MNKRYIEVSRDYLEKLLKAQEEAQQELMSNTFVDKLGRASVMMNYAKLEGTINYAKTLLKGEM